MTRLQLKTSSFCEVFEKNFEASLLKETRFKYEIHTLIYSRPLELKIINEESHCKDPFSLHALMM